MTPPAVSRVHCVVPVHNRLAITRRFVELFLAQDYPSLEVTIVDDGSDDGTAEYLASLGDARVRTLRGDGSLWWGGAMTLGMRDVFARAAEDDYLLMLNDDVEIDPGYVSVLVRVSRANGGAVVGSSQRFSGVNEPFAAAYRIDWARLRFVSVDPLAPGADIDALPARGLLFPLRLARAAGVVHRLLPHHLGDLEYTARVKERGGRLLVSSEAQTVTDDLPQAERARRRSRLWRTFGRRSPDNVWHRLVFFHSRGPWLHRLTVLPRLLLLPLLRRTP